MKTQANSHRQSSLKQMNPAALAIGAACLTLSLIISTTARADWGGGGFDGYSGNDGSQGGYSNDNASSGGNSQSSDSNNSGPLSMEQGLESRGTPGLIDSYARGEAAMDMEQALEERGVLDLIEAYAIADEYNNINLHAAYTLAPTKETQRGYNVVGLIGLVALNFAYMV